MRNPESWGPGPWDTEPNLSVWTDPAGYTCAVLRGPLGALNGYVGIPIGHPAHGIDYSTLDSQIEVHGGLTFAAGHSPRTVDGEPSVEDDKSLWWLGFDCAHAGDYAPGLSHWKGDTYRTFDYVKSEVESLARQLADYTPAGV